MFSKIHTEGNMSLIRLKTGTSVSPTTVAGLLDIIVGNKGIRETEDGRYTSMMQLLTQDISTRVESEDEDVFIADDMEVRARSGVTEILLKCKDSERVAWQARLCAVAAIARELHVPIVSKGEDCSADAFLDKYCPRLIDLEGATPEEEEEEERVVEKPKKRKKVTEESLRDAVENAGMEWHNVLSHVARNKRSDKIALAELPQDVLQHIKQFIKDSRPARRSVAVIPDEEEEEEEEDTKPSAADEDSEMSGSDMSAGSRAAFFNNSDESGDSDF